MPFHAADHVEGRFGFAAQGDLQEIFLDACGDGFAEFGSNFKEAIRWAKTFNALMRPLVIVIFDPQTNPFPSRIEAFKLGAGEELLPDGFPEPFDLAQRHGMMRPGLKVVCPVLFHLGLEASRAAPIDVFPPVIGEHFLGRLIFAGGDAKDFQHVLGGVTAKQIRAHDETRVIIHEGDEVGIASSQPKGEDVGLPHLVGGGPLEETGPDQITPRLGWRLNQALFVQRLTDGLRTGLEKEDPLE